MKTGKIFASALLLILSTGPAWGLEPVSRCQELDQWVSQLEKLPTEYEAFVALEPAERRAVYSRLSNGERAALWLRQLEQKLELGGWTKAQRDLIVEAERWLTEEKFAALRAPSGAGFEAMRAAAADLEDRLAASFSDEQKRQIFYDLGSTDDSKPSEDAQRPICDCSLAEGQDCNSASSCHIYNCVSHIWSCGSSTTLVAMAGAGLDAKSQGRVARSFRDSTAAPTTMNGWMRR